MMYIVHIRSMQIQDGHAQHNSARYHHTTAGKQYHRHGYLASYTLFHYVIRELFYENTNI